mgnify:CR=1 FL=1
MSTIDLKYQITEFYNKAVVSKYSRGKIHPVRIVQSVKSLIGINPASPLENLLKFCSNYLRDSATINFSYSKEEKIPEVVTLADLELSLKNKNIEESNKNAYYLSNVSDTKHILEFLLEISIKYNLNCFYSIWSVYKMMLFLKGENIFNNILFCIHEIVNDSIDMQLSEINLQDIDLKKYEYHQDTFGLLMIYYSVLNEDFIRIENISKYIKNNISHKLKFDGNIDELDVEEDQIINGRIWINNFIESLNMDVLNEDLILTLESCRGALKISDGMDTQIIWHNLNKYLKENGFK